MSKQEELVISLCHELMMVDFVGLPLENQINIFWYCDEKTLINIALTNKTYHHLILGEEHDHNDGESDQVDAYRNTIWKVRVLSELNRLIDLYNKSIIDNSIDTSLVHNLNEKDLDSYLRNNMRIKGNGIIRYSKVLYKLKNINFVNTTESNDKAVAIGRVLKNNGVITWYPFQNQNYLISGSSNNETLSEYCSFEGYEIVIDSYKNPSNNGWNIVFGIGGQSESFGTNHSIAEFTPENFGVGYIVHSNVFKIKGDIVYDIGLGLKNVQPVKVGDRFTVKIDRKRQLVHFFKNGLHLISVGAENGDILIPMNYYPIISMCAEKVVSFYPLLQVDYPIKENQTVKSGGYNFIY